MASKLLMSIIWCAFARGCVTDGSRYFGWVAVLSCLCLLVRCLLLPPNRRRGCLVRHPWESGAPGRVGLRLGLLHQILIGHVIGEHLDVQLGDALAEQLLDLDVVHGDVILDRVD